MKTKRPKIEVPSEPLDIITDLISATLLILMVIYTIMVYSDLPETIPIHFNAKGEGDNYGNKLTVWLLPAIGFALFIGLYFVNKFPHIHNYKINITEDNALKNYRLSTRIVRFTNLFCQALFAVIVFAIIQMAKGNESNILGIPFLIFTILIPVIGIAIIFYYQNKINK